MGASSSKKPPVIAVMSSPMYCLNMVGSRHFLMAGGGGGAKTGVKNELQTWLFGYDTEISQSAQTLPSEVGASLREAVTVDTSPYATMNLDVIPLGLPGASNGRYLIATSHDHFCDLYETDGFEVIERENDPPTLGLTPRHIARFESVTVANKRNDKYQKGVKFANIEGNLTLVTAGSDGMIRTWRIEEVLQHKERTRTLKEWSVCNSEVDDIEVTADGTTAFSIGDKALKIWDVVSGNMLYEVRSPEGYVPRSVRFTGRRKDNVFFVVGYNPNVPRGKQSKLIHWVFSLGRKELDLISSADVLPEKISKMGVQRGGRWIAVGTMEGSVAIYRASDLKAVKKIIGTHRDSFITGIEVLPDRTEDFPELKDSMKIKEIPGPRAETEVSVLTTSNDLTVQLHSVPYDNNASLAFAFILALLLMIVCPVIFGVLLKL